jgi:hypothetical protein
VTNSSAHNSQRPGRSGVDLCPALGCVRWSPSQCSCSACITQTWIFVSLLQFRSSRSPSRCLLIWVLSGTGSAQFLLLLVSCPSSLSRSSLLGSSAVEFLFAVGEWLASRTQVLIFTSSSCVWILAGTRSRSTLNLLDQNARGFLVLIALKRLLFEHVRKVFGEILVRIWIKFWYDFYRWFHLCSG